MAEMQDDDDVGEMWRAVRHQTQEHRAKMLAQANTEGWTRHTEYHFSRVFDRIRVEWWPSGGKAKIGSRMVYGHRNVRAALERLSNDSGNGDDGGR